MKNIINTIREVIGLDTILISVALAFIFGVMFAGISAQDEVSEEEITFKTECYDRYEEAMDYIMSDYSEYYYDSLQDIAVEEFYEERAKMLEVEGNDPLLKYGIRNMVKKFEERYNFEHNIYPFYTEDASLAIYYNMPEEGASVWEFTHKQAPKSKISQMMDELEEEFQDHIIEREGNSMWIEPIEDKPVLEQKLVSIENVDKPVIEQNLVSIKNINE